MNTGRPSSNQTDNHSHHEDTPSPLSSLPSEIRYNEIYPRSPLSVLGLLAQTSKRYAAETAFLRLLPAAIHAVPAFLDATEDPTALASIAILKKHPELLFIEKKVTDHYGREICTSPYRIFLGTVDLWALEEIQKNILPLIENGEDQAKAQFKAQFPNCPWPLPENFREEMLYDDRNKQQIKEIVQQLAVVKRLINLDPLHKKKPHDTTKQAIEMLCQLFRPKPGEIIRSGLHFPLAIINAVHNTYHALQPGRFSFFVLAVIKPAFDALSTVDGQCCQYGLNNFNMQKGPNRRCHPFYQHPLGKPLSLRLADDKAKRGVAALVDPYNGEVLFASTSDPGCFDCFSQNGRAGRRQGECSCGCITRCLLDRGKFWKSYVEQKQKHMRAIIEPHTEQAAQYRNEHSQPNRCVIL